MNATVGDLALKIHYGYTAKSTKRNTGVRMLRITDIQDFQVDWAKVPFCEIEQEDISKYLLGKGDIVFARTGATVGKSFLIKGKIPQAVFASYLIRIQLSTEIVPEYLYYFFQTPSYWNQISSSAKGVGQPNVNATSLAKVILNLAPLKEQYRIVSKIEELISDLDNGLANLKLAQSQLKIYRQALLKSAFEGKLTEQWRKENTPEPSKILLERIKLERKNRYEKELNDWKELVEIWEKTGKKSAKPRKPPKPVEYSELRKGDIDDFPSIPKSWVWVRNNDLLYYVTSGSRDWKKYYSKHGAYFIRTQDIKTNKLDLNATAFVSLLEKDEGKRSLVEKGDLLMTITGANVGKIAMIENDIPEAYVSQSVALLKPIEVETTPFLHKYFQSDVFGAKMINDLVYGVGRPVLSLENMREVAIALPSLEEQKVIVSEIDAQFSIIDNLEKMISSSISDSEALRYSILKKAFEGNLVEQDTRDEPASNLLKKIKLEQKQYLENKKQERKKAPKKMKKTKTTLLDIIKSNFSKESFTYSELKDQCDLSYEEIKTQLFELLEKGESLKSSFDSATEEIKYSHTP